MCIGHDYLNTADPCCALYVLRTTNNALWIFMTNNTAEKYVTPFDRDVYLKN
jgi:hypothetical protein